MPLSLSCGLATEEWFVPLLLFIPTLSLWCRDTHLSSIRSSIPPLCSSHLIPWELSYVISKATSKVIGKIPRENKSSEAQKC